MAAVGRPQEDDLVDLARGQEVGRFEDQLRQWLAEPPGERDRAFALKLTLLVDLAKATERPLDSPLKG